MRRRFVILLLLCALGEGCRTTEVDTRPKDPLLESKKPVERPAISAPATLLAAEPAPPPLPTMLAHRCDEVSRKAVQAQTVAGNRDGQLIVPTVRSVARPDSIFAHAEDFSSLQGVLDKHYEGHFDLRYGAAAANEQGSGKVRLDDDPRLAPFQDGDVVEIEGALVPNMDSATKPAWGHYPRYRIREIRLISRN